MMVFLAALLIRRMNANVCDDPIPLHNCTSKIPRHIHPLLMIQFVRQGKLVLTGDLGVMPFLGSFRGIPQTGAANRQSAFGKYNLLMQHPSRLITVIMNATGAVVDYPFSGTVRGGGRRAFAMFAAGRLY